ncbi:MAG: CehA/McbA family metallohydrolase [Candidatus Bathyarchaeia archaeon]
MAGLSMYEGLWLKGSLHCHSSLSDGLLSPDEVARFYAEKNYDFLSITDHEKLTKVASFSGIYCSGVEVSRGKSRLGEPYHIVILGIDDPAILGINDPQNLIDYVNSAGGLAIIAHPYWSNLTHEDLSQLQGYAGIEIYNTGCDVEVAKGYGLVHWDSLLSSNRKVMGIAVDDAHRYVRPPIDADGGYIWINVNDARLKDALESIRAGRFYSSMAPKIIYFHYTQSSIRVKSTPAVKLNLIAPNGRGFSISLNTIQGIIDCWRDPERKRIIERMITSLDYVDEGSYKAVYAETVKNEGISVKYNCEGVTEIEIRRDLSKYTYFRVEVIDHEGRYAWTNPVHNP